MGQSLPWKPWYWDEWDSHTAHLSHLKYSIYHRLLKHYYRTQKPLQANATDLLRVCLAFAEAEQAAMHEVLAEFFELRGDFYHNKRADIEIEKAINISKKRANAGSIGGKNRSSNSQTNAKQLPVHKHIQVHKQEQGGRKTLPPRQDMFDDMDSRKLKEAEETIRQRVQALVGTNEQAFTEAEYMTAVCEQSGLTARRVKELKQKFQWVS